MRSTGFVIVSIMVHCLAVAAIAMSPQQISEFTKGAAVEVNIGSPTEQPGIAEAPKPLETAPAAAPVAAAPVAPPAPEVKPVAVEKPAPKAPAPAKVKVAKAAAPKKAPAMAKELPVKQQLPEQMDPANDEADVLVPVKEQAQAEPASDQDTEANSEDIKKTDDPAPVGVTEEAPAAAAAPAPAAKVAATSNAPAVSAVPVGDLGKGGATQAGAVEFTELKQANGNRAPLYPLTARKEKRQGEVELLYRVTKDGQVADLSIAKSSGSEDLDQEAVRAISKFHFIPGQEGWAKHPVNFTLKGDTAALPSRLRSKVGSQE